MGFSAACILLYAGLAIAFPTVSFFKINNDAATTSGTTVILNNNATEAVAYRASERPDFAGAQWYAYSTAPVFVLSPGNGAKNVYFQIRNAQGRISQVAYDTIILQTVPQNSSYGIPKDNSLRDGKLNNNPPITNPLKDADLKQNIKDISQDRGPATQRDIGVRGLESDRGPATKDDAKKDKDIKNTAVITGGRYGDTFGAQRINDKTGSLNPTGVYGWDDPGGFTGGGKGNAGKQSDEQAALRTILRNSTKSSGKNEYGGNTYFKTYNEKSSGSYQFDKAGNKREITIQSDTDTLTTITWDASGKETSRRTFKNGVEVTTTTAGQPNPMGEDKGKDGIVVTPGTTVDQQIKRGMKTGGQVGGPGDGRNPDSGSTTGPSEHSGTSIMMGVTKGQEAKKPEEYGGTINMDKVLEINTKINPGK